MQRSEKTITTATLTPCRCSVSNLPEQVDIAEQRTDRENVLLAVHLRKQAAESHREIRSSSRRWRAPRR